MAVSKTQATNPLMFKTSVDSLASSLPFFFCFFLKVLRWAEGEMYANIMVIRKGYTGNSEVTHVIHS